MSRYLLPNFSETPGPNFVCMLDRSENWPTSIFYTTLMIRVAHPHCFVFLHMAKQRLQVHLVCIYILSNGAGKSAIEIVIEQKLTKS